MRRAVIPTCLAVGLLLAGCHASLPGTLQLAQAPAMGSLTLTFSLPQPADRQVLFVPVATTHSVAVTVAGPLYRDQTKSGSPLPLMQTSANFNVSPVGGQTSVTVNNVRPGHNLTVTVAVYDGPLANGQPSGKLLETLSGLVDIQASATASATIDWATTPTGLAASTLRQQDDPARLVATSGTALQTLVQSLIDTPTVGANPAALIDGTQLAQALLRYTRRQSNWPVANGYAIPAVGDPVLQGVVVQPAQVPQTQVFDLRGNPISTNLQLTVGDPISAVTTSAPYTTPKVAPGNWWVFLDGLNSETRHGAFYKTFAPGDANALPSAYLPGLASTFAGTGAPGAGTPAAPQFTNPHQMALDASGNLFVADTGNHRIVKLAPTGAMTIVAGTGLSGNTGVGGPATAATLKSPQGVAVDAAGNVFIADTGNNQIKVVDAASGKLQLLAGTGTAGYNGDGTANTCLLSGPANLALGGSPVSLYFQDAGNKLIRQIPIGATFITTTSVSSLAIPSLSPTNTGLAYQTVGGTDYLYYCALNPPQVMRRTMTGGGIGQTLVLAGGGAASAPLDDGIPGGKTALTQVQALAVDPTGDVYIADQLTATTGRVRFTNPQLFAEVYTVLGTSAAGNFGADGTPGPQTPIGAPAGIAAGAGTSTPIYVATGGDDRIVRLTP